jgi:hypothetical protein
MLNTYSHLEADGEPVIFLKVSSFAVLLDSAFSLSEQAAKLNAQLVAKRIALQIMGDSFHYGFGNKSHHSILGGLSSKSLTRVAQAQIRFSGTWFE